jgi:hypothetical protein
LRQKKKKNGLVVPLTSKSTSGLLSAHRHHQNFAASTTGNLRVFFDGFILE